MRPRSFVYPPAFLVWLWVVWSLRGPFRALTRGEPIDRERLARARRRVINLPWWVVVVCGTGWGLCIPVFLWRLQAGAEPLHPMVYAHLPISFVISGMIATTHGFFGVELLTQRRLYPAFFHDSPAWRTPGGHALSLRERGLLWALSAGVCPIVSLVLLAIVPKPVEEPGFALAVGAIGILFGLVTAWLVGRLVTEPIDDLTGAALSVSQGDLGVSIERSRADEFGPLIDAFNTMVGGLREKVRIEENFGRHVGQAVARGSWPGRRASAAPSSRSPCSSSTTADSPRVCSASRCSSPRRRGRRYGARPRSKSWRLSVSKGRGIRSSCFARWSHRRRHGRDGDEETEN